MDESSRALPPDSDAQPSAELNIFPSTAVSRLREPEAGFWSIETEALKQARGHLQDYLQRATRKQPDPSDTQGFVLAVVGDYGTGKTHIAQDMLHQIADERNPYLHSFYLDAPSDSFLALYRYRFMSELKRKEVLQRVDDYYADIVADELELSDLTKPIAEVLRSREVSADEVVKDFGLMESKFERELHDKLEAVTERSDFGTALLLLRRPVFQAAVWEWLKGEKPDVILQERGITRRIANDVDALEAIGVMAFLYGQQGHRFILFIDEIEKILSFSAAHQPDEATILALKKLMEVMSQTRAMLVLIGLPEFQEFLPEDARQRISSIVHPSALSVEEIEEYIREAKQRVTGREDISPFTMDAIYYLAELAGGNARKVIRICHHAYSAARVAGSDVTRAMLREITRDQFELSTSADVMDEIIRSVESRGWLFEKEKSFDHDGSKLRVDLWLPVGEQGAGIALFMATSILDESEVQSWAKHAETMTKVTSDSAPVESVLVVNGYISDSLRPDLDKAFSKVIQYRLRTFREDLDSVLAGSRIRLEERHREDLLSVIRQKVDQIARQNTGIDDQVSEVLHRGFDRHELQTVVSTGLREVFGQLASDSSLPESNYPRVAALFDEAMRAIDNVSSLDDTLDLIFGLPPWAVQAMVSERLSHSRGWAGRESLLDAYFRERGPNSLLLMKAACGAFRRGVFTCLTEFSPEVQEFPLDVLGEMCSAFDNLAVNVNFAEIIDETSRFRDLIFRELGLEEYVGLRLNTGKTSSRSAVAKAARTVRELGRQVYDAVTDEIRGTPIRRKLIRP